MQAKRKISLISILVTFVLNCCFALQSADIVRWATETNNSINANIKQPCTWELVPGLSVPEESSDVFYASINYPSKNELASFQSLPSTLMQANSFNKASAIKQGFEKWSTEKESQWHVPVDHVAQNRTMCFDLVKLASKEGVLDIYQGFKPVLKTFYILRNRHAVIHPSGKRFVSMSITFFVTNERKPSSFPLARFCDGRMRLLPGSRGLRDPLAR